VYSNKQHTIDRVHTFPPGQNARCGNVMQSRDCDFVAQANTEAEMLQQAATQARLVHNMQEIPAEAIAAVRVALSVIQSIPTIVSEGVPAAG
jgi:predicted small metal-binding protein